MSWCDKQHLEDMSLDEILDEIEFSAQKGWLNNDHFHRLIEIYTNYVDQEDPDK